MDKASLYSSQQDKLARTTSMIGILPNDVIGARSSNRHRPLCTLSIVIGSLSAFSVLLIAGITFAITYTSSLHSIDELGRGYAVSVVDAGRVQVEGLFAVPSNFFRTLSRLHQQEGIVEPQDDPTKWDVLKMASMAIVQARLGTPELTIASLFYDDGSVVKVDQQNGTMLVQLLNGRGLNATTKCCLENQQREFYVTNMTRPATQAFPYSQFTLDMRLPVFDQVKPIIAFSASGTWFGATLSEQPGISRTFVVPLAGAIRNQSGYLGMIVLGTHLEAIGGFLAKLKRTANSHVFVFDSVPAIIATTHPAEYRTFTATTNPSLIPSANCANSAQNAAAGVTSYTVACRARPQEYPYPPLQTLGREYPKVIRVAAGMQAIVNFDTPDGRHYAASAGLTNADRNFDYSLLLLMPEDDILGGITTARNTAIGVICAVVVVAAAMAAAVITLVLRPLGVVSTRMRRTAHLREEVPIADGEMSRLAELYDLEDAYQNMDMAIRSFTRYVPRDVVKDLLATGELCAIRMQPKNCTMMFTDIQGFTTMCERVAPSELSHLVQSYFETMSSIVMGHEGLIDKFIGDCIMVVWGAPFAVPNAEVKAALCGLRMIRETKVPPLAAQFDASGEQLHVRVGLASGTVLAGNMGSSERMNYTVIGDAVNLAARLESLNKQFGTSMMMSDAVQRKVSGVFTSRLLLAIRVVGKEEAVKVYEPIGIRPSEGTQRVDPQVASAMRAQEDKRLFHDSMSAMSDYSMVSHAPAERHREKDAVQLVEEAMRITHVPITVSVDEHMFTTMHTKAVEQFMARDFAGAISTLEQMKTTRIMSDQLTNTVPAAKLEELCHGYLRNAPGPEFDGVWMSHQK
jgi:class 3 adenylate cyclase